jgi:hypothetical protein
VERELARGRRGIYCERVGHAADEPRDDRVGKPLDPQHEAPVTIGFGYRPPPQGLEAGPYDGLAVLLGDHASTECRLRLGMNDHGR